MARLSLDQIVSGVNDLPALPHVTLQVMRLADDPSSLAQDINAAIIQDQSLTAKVLRLANSAFYGFPRRISTVTEATVLLGFNTIKSIVMAASVSDMMSREVVGYALAPGELWRHSQATAMAARYIARKVRYRNPDVAYTGALLHDIGKVILNHHVEVAYTDVVQAIKDQGLDFIKAEQEILGFTHAQIGARVGEKWNLPRELVEAIAHHHTPESAAENQKLTAIVHMADAMCMMMGIGLGLDGMMYPFSDVALQNLNMSTGDAEEMVASLIDVFSDDNSFLG
ncbi:MAG: HDOD domain-containing protein [Acidobacteriota bacterium]